jgi:hypothetical protein
MPPQPLAPVYLDDEPVSLLGDPRPQVSKVLAASGREAGQVRVRRLEDEQDHDGIAVALDAFLDRTTEPTKPIYLTTAEPPTTRGATGQGGAAASDAGLNGPQQFVGDRATGAFGQGPAAPLAEPPGVSGQGNARGSAQSAYSRTGTDTAQPGMATPAEDFGIGTGKGTSSGARESGKPTAEAAPAGPLPSLEEPFGREGLHGKQGMGPMELRGPEGTARGPGTDPSGTGSEVKAKTGHAQQAPVAAADVELTASPEDAHAAAGETLGADDPNA